MARLDKIHEAVKNALIKDGWTITAENFQFHFNELELYGDLEAQKTIFERISQNIFVKIKDFFEASIISDFERAYGQFLLYKTILPEIKPDVKTYLAFSESDYDNFFSSRAIRTIIEEEKLSFFVLNLENETITKWKN